MFLRWLPRLGYKCYFDFLHLEKNLKVKMWKKKKRQCSEIEETAVLWGNCVKLHWSKEISGNLCKFMQQQNSTLDITISNCVFSAELDSSMSAYLYLVFLY